MERKDENKSGSPKGTERDRNEQDKHNPFKESGVPNEEVNPEEEADAEQQRKEALTERDQEKKGAEI